MHQRHWSGRQLQRQPCWRIPARRELFTMLPGIQLFWDCSMLEKVGGYHSRMLICSIDKNNSCIVYPETANATSYSIPGCVPIVASTTSSSFATSTIAGCPTCASGTGYGPAPTASVSGFPGTTVNGTSGYAPSKLLACVCEDNYADMFPVGSATGAATATPVTPTSPATFTGGAVANAGTLLAGVGLLVAYFL